MAIVITKINAYNVILEKKREYPNDIPLDDEGNISSAFHEYIKRSKIFDTHKELTETIYKENRI